MVALTPVSCKNATFGDGDMSVYGSSLKGMTNKLATVTALISK